MIRAREAGDSRNTTIRVVYSVVSPILKRSSAARLRGLMILIDFNLGFRCAPPQALCYRRLRRLATHPDKSKCKRI